MVQDVCNGVRSIIPPLSALMFIGSGVVYVAGQFTGAEMRARAVVWATSMLIGALIGLLIVTVVPPALSILSTASTGQALTGIC